MCITAMDTAVSGCKTNRGRGSAKLRRIALLLLLGRAEKLYRRKRLCRPGPVTIDRELGWLSGLHFHVQVVVILFRSLALPILVQWITLRDLDVRSAGQDWILFRSPAAEHKIPHAVHLVGFGRVHVSVEHHDVQILRVRRYCLMWILVFGNRTHTGSAERWSVKCDEHLFRPLGLGLIQPQLELLHLFFESRACRPPTAGFSIIVLSSPQEDEPHPIEIKFVNELLIGNAK